MLNSYEELREKQLEFLDKWNQSIVIPARKEAKHDHFRVSLNEIYALKIDDITFFADQNKMTFEYDDVNGNGIIFKDIKLRRETKRGGINERGI